MRRLLLLLVCAALLLTGCQGAETAEAAPVYALYFQAADLNQSAGAGALSPEYRSFPLSQDASAQETAEALLSALLEGPERMDLQSPIPQGTSLLSLELAGSRAAVDLSAAYGSLSGVALTLADYAITLTLTQLPSISLVRITVRGQELAYRDLQAFTARDVSLTPEGDVVSTVTVRLYFPDEEGVLTPEARTLSLYEGDTQVGAVAQALEAGPEDKTLFPALPEGFRVGAVWLEEDICYVNLSSALLDSLPGTAALPMALSALDRSLLSLDTVRATRYLVDGEFVAQYGQLKLTEPYTILPPAQEAPPEG